MKENENFWRKEGKRITWIKPYTKKNIKHEKAANWQTRNTINETKNAKRQGMTPHDSVLTSEC